MDVHLRTRLHRSADPHARAFHHHHHDGDALLGPRTKSWLEAFASIGVLELISNAPLAAKYGQLPPNARKPFANLGLSERELSHWAAAEAADHGLGEDGGSHGEDALAVLAKYAKTTEQQDACGHALRESIQVLRVMYDAVGRAGIETTKRARPVKA